MEKCPVCDNNAKKIIKTLAPVILNSDIEEKTEILSNVFLEKFTEEERSDFYGVKIKEISQEGEPISLNEGISLGGFNHKLEISNINSRIPFNMYNMNSPEIYANYKLIFDCNDGVYLEKAFMLINTGNFGLCHKFTIEDSFRSLVIPGKKPYAKCFPYTKFNKSDIDNFRKIYPIIFKSKDDKRLKLIFNKLKFVISSDQIPNENRFIDLMTIMEMLYLPELGNELKFRLSLRTAKIFNKFYNDDSNKVFNEIKKVYDIRSSIIHNGEAKTKKGQLINLTDESNNILVKFLNIVRKSILVYAKNPKFFSQDNLNKICLE